MNMKTMKKKMMRIINKIFNIILFIFSFNFSLYSYEEKSLNLEIILSQQNFYEHLKENNFIFNQKIDSESEAQEIIGCNLNILELNGYIDAVLEFTDIEQNETLNVIRYSLKLGRRYKFDNLIIEGKFIPEYILRDFWELKRGDFFSKNRIEEFSENCEALYFVKKIDFLGYKKKLNNYADIYISAETENTVSINGALTYSENRTGVNGSFYLVNPFGMGQKLNLNADYGEKRQEMAFSFYNPYIFSGYINLEGNFSQKLIKDISSSFSAELKILWNWKNRYIIGEGLKWVRTKNEADSLDESYTRRFLSVSAEINSERKKTENNKMEIKKSFNIQTDLKFAFYYNFEDKISVYEWDGLIGFEYKSLFADIFSEYRGIHGKEVRQSDIYYYGGADNLRGYLEDIFSGFEYYGIRNEAGLKIGRSFRFFLHEDIYYSKVSDFRSGYGIGFQLQTGGVKHIFTVSFPNKPEYDLAVLHYLIESGF